MGQHARMAETLTTCFFLALLTLMFSVLRNALVDSGDFLSPDLHGILFHIKIARFSGAMLWHRHASAFFRYAGFAANR